MTPKQEEMLRQNAEGKIHLSDIAIAREFAAAGDPRESVKISYTETRRREDVSALAFNTRIATDQERTRLEFAKAWEQANMNVAPILHYTEHRSCPPPDPPPPASTFDAIPEEQITAAQAERTRQLLAGNFIGVLEDVKDHFAPDHSIFEPDHSKFEKSHHF